MWCNPRNLHFKSPLVSETIDEKSLFFPLKKISGAFRTIVTDCWAGRRWAIHDNGYWLELQRADNGGWFSFIGFYV